MADFNSIKIDKSMYARSGKNLTQQLEEMDPSANYRGTELEGLDAFQRQLKRFDIKVKGRNSDTVEKFSRQGTARRCFRNLSDEACSRESTRAICWEI